MGQIGTNFRPYCSSWYRGTTVSHGLDWGTLYWQLRFDGMNACYFQAWAGDLWCTQLCAHYKFLWNVEYDENLMSSCIMSYSMICIVYIYWALAHVVVVMQVRLHLSSCICQKVGWHALHIVIGAIWTLLALCGRTFVLSCAFWNLYQLWGLFFLLLGQRFILRCNLL